MYIQIVVDHPIGLYTHCGPDVLYMPFCKRFLYFLSFVVYLITLLLGAMS